MVSCWRQRGCKRRESEFGDGEDEKAASVGRHRDSLQGVAFLPDGKRIVSVDRGGAAAMWKVPTKYLPIADLPTLTPSQRSQVAQDDALLASWNAHEGRINGIAVNPDGRYVATVAADGHLRMTDLQGAARDGRIPIELPSHVWHFDFGPHDELLCWDLFATLEWPSGENAWLCDLSSGKQERFHNPTPWGICSASILPDRDTVLLGHEEGRISIFNRNKRDQFESRNLQTRSHVNGFHLLGDGRTLCVSVWKDPDSIRFFDYAFCRLDGAPRCIADGARLSPSRQWLVAHDSRYVHLWNCNDRGTTAREFTSVNRLRTPMCLPTTNSLRPGAKIESSRSEKSIPARFARG